MRWIFACVGSYPFDIETIDKRPIGGTKSCIIYLIQHLLKLDQEVHFFHEHIDKKSKKNFHQYNMNTFSDINKISADILVYIGPTNLISSLKKEKKNLPLIYWAHQASNQGRESHLKDTNISSGIDTIVYASKWQQRDFIQNLDISNIKSAVIGHGITVEFQNLFSSFDDFKSKKEENFGIYTSVPYRGLEILVNSEKYLRSENMTIDIFSSMKIYQKEDTKYLKLIYEIEKIKKFNYFGSVKKRILAEAHKNKSYFLYPSTYAEIFCCSAIDAIAAGCEVISSNLGCLKEIYYPYGSFLNFEEKDNIDSFSKRYANLIISRLNQKKNNFDGWVTKQYEAMMDVHNKFNWVNRCKEWIKLAQNLT